MKTQSSQQPSGESEATTYSCYASRLMKAQMQLNAGLQGSNKCSDRL